MIDLSKKVYSGSPDQLKMPLICIHGDAGIGKTTFAVDAPDALIIPVEDGLGALAALPNLHMVDTPKSAKEVDQYLDALINQEHNFKWLIIDSLTALEKAMWKDLAKDANATSIEEVGGGYGKGFTAALEWFNQFIYKLRVLRDTRNVGVIAIAHTTVKTINPPDKPSFDRYILNLHQKVSDYIFSQFDLVGYCEFEKIVKKEDIGFGQEQGKLMETGNRLIRINKSDTYFSKNRYRIDDSAPIPLQFNALMQAIQNQINQLQQPQGVAAVNQ